MKTRLYGTGIYALYWLIFFAFARLFFIITHLSESAGCGAVTLAGTFFHGSRLDISMTAYFLAVPLLLITADTWTGGRWLRVFMRCYTTILVLVSSILVVADTVLYRYWGYRMDYTALTYLDKPKDAAASVSTLLIIGVVAAVILITIGFRFIYMRFVDRFFAGADIKKHKLAITALFIFLTSFLIIPVRGGTGLAPINAGSVYFTEKMFANHTAVNVVWNVGSSVFNRKKSGNPYAYLEPQYARMLTRKLLDPKGETDTVLNNKRPDILIVILESFGNSLIGPLGGDSLTTPCINKYIKEGILFRNFYSSGNRTDKALPAILSGYPAQPAVSIIKDPRKTQSLMSLTKIMDSLGYSSSFWYGGDINFANINSYLISTGFRSIISMKNFSPSDYNSKWGVHDHILFKALKDSMQSPREPFFRVVLTLSSHEPFEVPVPPVFKGNDEPTRFRNSVHYTDNSLGSFLDWAQATEWWKNTLVILVADHCRRNSSTDLVFSKSIFQIPMIWFGGAVGRKGTEVNKTGSQVDIPITLLDQLGIRSDFGFGKDLFSAQSNSFAFYSFNEGFAFITDSSSFIFDHKLRGPVLKEGKGVREAEDYGKAYQQILYDDYLKR